MIGLKRPTFLVLVHSDLRFGGYDRREISPGLWLRA
jgi:hypothetical protein